MEREFQLAFGQQIDQWISLHQEEIRELSDRIFQHPEAAEQERFACSLLCGYLREKGFTLEQPAGGMNTAFCARWDNGGPCIGFMAEYDALPNSFQPVEETQHPASEKPGHVCGHHLIAVVCATAAAAVKELAQKEHIPVSVTVFGCPAEETMKGKVELAKAGAFSGLDAALCWHPEDFNGAVAYRCNAISIVHYRFEGISAHASVAPYLGRSALDACELMNVGANYLREHIEPSCRFHYAYLDAPSVPNIVPPKAGLIYYIRGRDVSQVVNVRYRLRDVAEGAALMAGVRMQEEIVTTVPETRPNLPLTHLADEILRQTQLEAFTEEEIRFAHRLRENSGFQPVEEPLRAEVRRFGGQIEQRNGSSDVAAVSELIPTVMLRNTCVPVGIPQHHWAFAASCGSSIGLRGARNGIRVLAALTLSLADRPTLLESVKNY